MLLGAIPFFTWNFAVLPETVGQEYSQLQIDELNWSKVSTKGAALALKTKAVNKASVVLRSEERRVNPG